MSYKNDKNSSTMQDVLFIFKKIIRVRVENINLQNFILFPILLKEKPYSSESRMKHYITTAIRSINLRRKWIWVKSSDRWIFENESSHFIQWARYSKINLSPGALLGCYLRSL